MNQDKKGLVNERPVPDPNEEILFYQTLVGAWPLRPQEVPEFRERLKAYMIKAAREAKLHTSWLHPDEAYEKALTSFVEACLDTSRPNEFLDDFLPFEGRIAYYGALNSLAQVLLKAASPGVPDFYQGTELWDFSLVDPDNRRPVDFSKRTQILSELKRLAAGDLVRLVRELLARWQDGRVKMYLTSRALDFRRAQKSLFQGGAYIPLTVSGEEKEHVVAFARQNGHTWALVAVLRLVTRVCTPGRRCVDRIMGQDSFVTLPARAPAQWVNVLTGETSRALPTSDGQVIHLHDLFRHLPVALLSSVSA
jgi:(1->4)-alpha-D-glucan 1-alpha-D-glucosylmutase